MKLRVASKWFDRKRFDDDITLIWEPNVHPMIRCNIWHVRGRDNDLLIDSGLGVASLREASKDLFQKSIIAVATHTHFDHTGGMHEFENRVVHELESRSMAEAWDGKILKVSGFGARAKEAFETAGYNFDQDELLTALPEAGFDFKKQKLEPAAPTWIVNEGDVIDLGDRAFEVLHLPGHSPGSIGLYHPKTRTLFSGDAVYDGPLLYDLPGSDIEAYVSTMEKLLRLPVDIVHGGHDNSFSGARFREILKQYLDLWAQGRAIKG